MSPLFNFLYSEFLLNFNHLNLMHIIIFILSYLNFLYLFKAIFFSYLQKQEYVKLTELIESNTDHTFQSCNSFFFMMYHYYLKMAYYNLPIDINFYQQFKKKNDIKCYKNYLKYNVILSFLLGLSHFAYCYFRFYPNVLDHFSAISLITVAPFLLVIIVIALFIREYVSYIETVLLAHISDFEDLLKEKIK